jgi:hypothetical protein
MKISMVVFWVIMAHDLADGYHALEEHITSTFTMEMELIHSSKMLTTTRHQNPADHHQPM